MICMDLSVRKGKEQNLNGMLSVGVGYLLKKKRKSKEKYSRRNVKEEESFRERFRFE